MPDQLENRADKPLVLSRWERWHIKCCLNSFDEKTRFKTVETLLEQGEPGLRLMLELMDEYSRSRRRYHNLIFCVLLFYLAPTPLSTGAQKLLIFFGFINLFFGYRHYSRAFETAADTVSKRGDMRFIPLFLKYWVIGSSGEDADGGFLAKMLPQMKLKDSALLKPEHRRKLNRHLFFAPIKRRVKTTDLRLAILKAYEQIGDASSLEAVEELLTKNIDAKLRDAAETCLLYLKQNVGRVAEVQTLLRASALPDKPEELLRPAREKREEEPLLRPAMSPPRDSESE